MITVSGTRKHLLHASLGMAIWAWATYCVGQTNTAATKPGLALPANASTKKADEFLATLRPPTSVNTLESGNDLLLDFPDVAAAGPVRVKAVSTIPNTDGIWLLSLSPQPDSGAALFAAVTLSPSSLPDTTLLLNLTKTQPILLVVRARGSYYGLQREIKIGNLSPDLKKK